MKFNALTTILSNVILTKEINQIKITVLIELSGGLLRPSNWLRTLMSRHHHHHRHRQIIFPFLFGQHRQIVREAIFFEDLLMLLPSVCHTLLRYMAPEIYVIMILGLFSNKLKSLNI